MKIGSAEPFEKLTRVCVDHEFTFTTVVEAVHTIAIIIEK